MAVKAGVQVLALAPANLDVKVKTNTIHDRL
jgi:hypothetical protein